MHPRRRRAARNQRIAEERRVSISFTFSFSAGSFVSPLTCILRDRRIKISRPYFRFAARPVSRKHIRTRGSIESGIGKTNECRGPRFSKFGFRVSFFFLFFPPRLFRFIVHGSEWFTNFRQSFEVSRPEILVRYEGEHFVAKKVHTSSVSHTYIHIYIYRFREPAENLM